MNRRALLIMFFIVFSTFTNPVEGQSTDVTLDDYNNIKYGIKTKLDNLLKYFTCMADPKNKARQLNYKCAWESFYDQNNRYVEISLARKIPTVSRLKLDTYLKQFLNQNGFKEIHIVRSGDILLSPLIKKGDGSYNTEVKFIQKFECKRHIYNNELGDIPINNIDIDEKKIGVSIRKFVYTNDQYQKIIGFDIYFGDIQVDATVTK